MITNPRGQSTARDITVVLSLLFWTLVNPPAKAQTITWTQTNGPFQGNVYAIIWNSSGETFAGTADSGVFRSTDSGTSWVKSNNGLTNLTVYSLLTKTGGTTFAGTSNGSIFRSTNSGTSWVPSGIGLTTTAVYALVANATGYVFAGTWGGGVFLSTNDGTNWSPARNGLADTIVQALIMNRSGQLFAGTYRRGVFRSTNNGGSWVQANTGMSDSSVNVLAVDSSGHLLAGTRAGGLFHSTDAGNHWSAITSALPSLNINAVGVSSAGTIYAGTWSRGIYSSTDDGITWAQSGWPAGITHAVSRGQGTSMLVGCDGGLYRLDGNVLAQVGVRRAQTVCIAARPGGHLFAGVGGADGVFYSLNNGVSWSSAPIAADVSRLLLCLDVDAHGYIIAGTQGGLYISTNEGASWLGVGAVGADMFHAVAVAPSGYLFATSGSSYTRGQIFRSTDGGQSWTRIYNYTPPPPPAPQYSQFDALACDANGGLWACSTTLGILRSTNHGSSWAGQSFTTQTDNAMITDQGGIVLAGGTRGIYRSTNRGLTWQQSNAGLTDTLVFSLATNRDNHIFAGTRSGVYRTTNSGLNWVAVSTGLQGLSIRRLFVDTQGFGFAATWGGGVYRTLGTTVSAENTLTLVPNTAVLNQNYPNPFNPSTTIRYALPVRSNVKLTVYNTLGQEVATLVEGEKEAGYHEAVFDASGMASGVYFYRLTADSFVETRKLLLLR